ncbi:PREDICTED: sorting nexin-16-like [Priapulus caudatus]|uniref:Sorting nexin-16-like n=1 Tax=Priapulus caudatus TaxID=37621 RepID=A0ABM1F0I5_PRICU|nr:PREDICTED: sorting nexin-16-like [Priapulus caudatus]
MNNSSGGGGTNETTSTPAGSATAVGVVEGDAPEDAGDALVTDAGDALVTDAGDALVTDATQTDTSVAHELTVPIVGYEVMEQRARFTVYKVHVQRGPHDSWFIFRRYTDFVRLNRKVSMITGLILT